MATLLRLYSYLYHGILALFLLGIAVVAYSSSSHELSLSVLPWKGDELIRYLLIGGILGLLSIILAIAGVVRFLFPLWALIVFGFMFYGFLIRPYQFAGKSEFYAVLWLIAGAFGAFLSSLTLFKRPKRR